MYSKLVEKIKRNLGSGDTTELLEIWNTNDRKSYSDEAFEAIKSILIERGVAIPQQPVYVQTQKEEKIVISNNKTTAGLIFIWVGIIGIVMGFGIACGTISSMTNMDAPEDWPIIYAGTIIGMVGWFIVIAGAILYFVGRRQGKKRRNLPEAHDSNSDYNNKTVKKS